MVKEKEKEKEKERIKGQKKRQVFLAEGIILLRILILIEAL